MVIDNPQGEQYYGGQLAAPAVGKIASYALRQLRIPTHADSVPGERRRAEPAPQPPPTTTVPVGPDLDRPDVPGTDLMLVMPG